MVAASPTDILARDSECHTSRAEGASAASVDRLTPPVNDNVVWAEAGKLDAKTKNTRVKTSDSRFMENLLMGG
jgi:hypothetical protein